MPVDHVKHRVLLADDDHAMRGMLESALLRAGFEVETASDGADLLERLDAAKRDRRAPQIIVCDICMPGLTGFDVLLRVRSHFPAVPVILITAFGDAITHRRAQALGAVEVIDKPFDLGLLCRRITAILDGEQVV